jgi:hypothetical protein
MSFSEAWKNAGAEEIEPPAGTYKVRIVRGAANLSNAGDPKANVILEITDGELAGSHIDHFMWFAHPVSARISKEALITYGLRDPDAVEEIEDLDDAIQALVGTTADVGVSYKDGRMNIKVHGSRSPQPMSDIPNDVPPTVPPTAPPEAQTSFAAAAGAKADDGIPF